MTSVSRRSTKGMTGLILIIFGVIIIVNDILDQVDARA